MAASASGEGVARRVAAKLGENTHAQRQKEKKAIGKVRWGFSDRRILYKQKGIEHNAVFYGSMSIVGVKS